MKAKKKTPAPPARKQPRGGENIPDTIVAPGYGPERGTSWISPGRYHMKGGSIAVVTGPCTIKFGVGMRDTWHGWKGHLEGHPDGEGLNWSLDGKRSDATPDHEHDLTRRHKDQKPRKAKADA